MSTRLRRRGFTLIELLVVIAIIAVLVAILLPAVQQAREAARASQCRNNLKQFGIALHSYAETHSTLPYGGQGLPGNANNMSFHVLILPYMDQAGLYNKFNFSLHYNSDVGAPDSNYRLKEQRAPYFVCPSSRTADQSYTEPAPSMGLSDHVTAVIHYCGIQGAKGLIPGSTTVSFPMLASVSATTDHGGLASNGLLIRNRAYKLSDATDGLTNTFLMGEISADHPGSPWSHNWRPWTQGTSGDASGAAVYYSKNIAKPIARNSGYQGSTANRLFNDVAFSSKHTSGTHFMMGDGSVRFVGESIDFATYQLAASKDDNINSVIPE